MNALSSIPNATRLIVSTVLIVVAIASVSCKKGNSVVVSENVDGFHTVQLNYSFDVILVEDSIPFIVIKTTERFAPNVEFDVSDSVLTMGYAKKGRWLYPKDRIIIEIHNPSIQKVVANETCNVSCKTPITTRQFGIVLKSKANEAMLDLNCESFYYWNHHPTGGMLTLRGNVDSLDIWNTAIMSVDAIDLQSSFAQVEQDSHGDISIHVSDELHYKISNKGNIHVYGNPGEVYHNGTASSGEVIFH